MKFVREKMDRGLQTSLLDAVSVWCVCGRGLWCGVVVVVVVVVCVCVVWYGVVWYVCCGVVWYGVCVWCGVYIVVWCDVYVAVWWVCGVVWFV